MASLLLTNGYLVTVDPDRRVIPNGWLAVEDDTIAALGPMEDLGDRTADTVIDLHGMVTLPGLVNGHNHHWGSLFKNTGEGLVLEDWLDAVTRPLIGVLTNQDLRIGAYLGAIEQLRTGTTCSLNHAVNVNDGESLAATIEPVLEVGVRQLVTKELRDPPVRPFSDRYPVPDHPRDRGEELALAEELVARWAGAGGLIHMGLALETGGHWMLHNVTSEELVEEGVALAERRRLKITNHCSSGTPWRSTREFEQLTGGGDIDLLSRLGALTDRWVFAHGMHLHDREIEHVARCGASIVANPVSNAYSCGGVAPFRKFFAAGVTVGLGSDGAYVNCSVDMVEQMKFAALIQNVTHFDPTLVTAERAIELATIDGARAIGLGDLIGSLEAGKRADVVAFDLGRAHVTVANRPVAALVFSAHGTDAALVVVNGEVRLHEGKLRCFDREAEVLEEARRRAAEACERAGIAGRIAVAWQPVGLPV